MKTKEKYVQELTDKMTDLREAVASQDDERVTEITEECRAILNDIEEA